MKISEIFLIKKHCMFVIWTCVEILLKSNTVKKFHREVLKKVGKQNHLLSSMYVCSNKAAIYVLNRNRIMYILERKSSILSKTKKPFLLCSIQGR